MTKETTDDDTRQVFASSRAAQTQRVKSGRLKITKLPTSLSDLEVILQRQTAIERHQPKCPECSSKQVQIMSKAIPAMWRCRVCKHYFVSEPLSASS